MSGQTAQSVFAISGSLYRSATGWNGPPRQQQAACKVGALHGNHAYAEFDRHMSRFVLWVSHRNIGLSLASLEAAYRSPAGTFHSLATQTNPCNRWTSIGVRRNERGESRAS